MKVNVNSWHYLLQKNVCKSDKGIPLSLCPYFWATMWRIVFLIVVTIICTFILNMLGFAALMSLTELFGIVPLGDSATMSIIGMSVYISVPILCLVGIVALSLAIIAGLIIVFVPPFLWKHTKKLFKTKSVSVPIQHVQDSLIVEFVKAKHSKVCPMIELDYTHKPSLLERLKKRFNK